MTGVRQASWYLDAGYPQEALEALRGADLSDPEVAYVAGAALVDTGKPAEAESVVRRALASAPEDLLLLEVLARAQMGDDPGAAETTLRTALAVEPENPRLLGLCVVALLRQRRHEAAERVLEQLMRVAPEDRTAQQVRALFLLQAAESSSALAAAEALLREHPDEAFNHYIQGLTHMRRRWWKGLWHLREAARLRPQDPVLVETARLMNAWYALPVHALGPARWLVVIPLSAWVMVALVRDASTLVPMLVLFGFAVLHWTAHIALHVALDRRIKRALRDMYG